MRASYAAAARSAFNTPDVKDSTFIRVRLVIKMAIKGWLNVRLSI